MEIMLLKTIKLATKICDEHDQSMFKLTSAISCAKIVENLGYPIYHQSLVILSFFPCYVTDDDLTKIFGNSKNPRYVLNTLWDYLDTSMSEEEKFNKYPSSNSNSFFAAVLLAARVLEKLNLFILGSKNDEVIKDECIIIINNYLGLLAEKYPLGYKKVVNEMARLT